jgi:hypothetical protein
MATPVLPARRPARIPLDLLLAAHAINPDRTLRLLSEFGKPRHPASARWIVVLDGDVGGEL